MQKLYDVLVLIVLSAVLILPGSRQSFSGMEWLQGNVISSVQDSHPFLPDRIDRTNHAGEETNVLPGRPQDCFRKGKPVSRTVRDIPFLPAEITVFLPEITVHISHDITAQFTVLFRSDGSFRRKLIPRSSSFIA